MSAPVLQASALRRRDAALLAVATAAAYANTFGASFHFDDYGIAVPSGLVVPTLAWPPVGSRWLGEATFAVNRALGGSLAGFHAVNLAIHVAASLLVAVLVGRLLRAPAIHPGAGALLRERLPLSAGLLFALHPLATQAVTYVVQRFTSLATLLYLLSVVMFLGARLALEREDRFSWPVLIQAAGSALAALGAMKTKEISVTLPVAALGLEVLFFRGRHWRALWLWLPILAAGLLPFLEPGLGQRIATEAPLPPVHYALTQARVVVMYLGLLIWPAGQNIDHDVTLSTGIGEPAVLASIALLLAVIGTGGWLLWVGRRERRPGPLLVGAGVAWFFLTLAVESSFLPIRDVMFEHRVYLPSVGAALAAGVLLLRAAERITSLGTPGLRVTILLALVVTPLGVATHLRNRVWQDDLLLWGDAAAKSPGKARPHQMLGEAHAQRGEHEVAVREYLAALRIDSRYLEAWFNLGHSYLALGDLDRGLVAFEAAIQAAPGFAMAHNNRGATLQRLGRLEDAARAYRDALKIDPALPAAKANLDRLESIREAGSSNVH